MNAAPPRTEKPLSLLSESDRPAFTMGWQGLPEDMNDLICGGAYSLSIRRAISHVRMIASVLAANLANHGRCALLTPMAPETFLKRCPASHQRLLRTAVEQKQLLLFTVLGDAQKNIVRFGPERLLAEVAAAGIDHSCLLVVDQAEDLFSLHHQESAAAQLDSYRQWLQQHDCTVLFLFLKISDDHALSWTHYSLTEKMSGSAHLDYDRDEAELWIDFWQSTNTTLGEHHVRLQKGYWKGPSGKADITASLPRLRLASMPPSTREPLAQADDAMDLYYLGTLGLPAGRLKSWNRRPVSTLRELIQATQNACNATVLVTVNRKTDWLQLAQAVHTIRTQAGSRLRILIIDQEQCIRYQHEALLLRAGANLVLHATDALVRLPLLLDSPQSLHYRQAETACFEEALAGATPPQLKGYVPPLIFCKTAQESLVRARALPLPCALVILPYSLLQDLSTSMPGSHFSRDGDLLTIVSRHCYLFLYGCLTDDYPGLVQRLIGSSDPVPLDGATFLLEEDAILDMLKSVTELCMATATATEKSFSAPLLSIQPQLA